MDTRDLNLWHDYLQALREATVDTRKDFGEFVEEKRAEENGSSEWHVGGYSESEDIGTSLDVDGWPNNKTVDDIELKSKPKKPTNTDTGLEKPIEDKDSINIKIDNSSLTEEEIKRAVKEGVIEGLNEFVEELKSKGARGFYGGGF